MIQKKHTTDNLDEAQVADKIHELEQQLEGAKNDHLRSLADYQNLLRRTQDERSRTVKLATQSLVEDLIEHLDHLALAAEHSKDPGLAMIVGQLWQTLENHGLKEIAALGKPFDANMMEAVEAAESADDTSESETALVQKVVTRGYTLNGYVLRPAKVVIARKL